jgi:hypothetical protein
LDDELWELRFNFIGEDNLERALGCSDISVLNMFALIEENGYGIRDAIYYVKEKGKVMTGMEMVDTMAKVEAMLTMYKHSQVLQLTTIKRNTTPAAGLNLEIVESQKLIMEPLVMSVDSVGVTHIADDDGGGGGVMDALYLVVIDILMCFTLSCSRF